MNLIENILLSEVFDYTYTNILKFVQYENYKLGVYEGNQYTIIKLNKKTIFVGDHISDSYDSYEEADFTRKNIVISVDDFVKEMKKHKGKFELK